MTQLNHIKQQGAALISVLIILVVITLLGVAAMRMSISSLSLATNSQVSQLLFQSADFGTIRMVNVIKSNPSAVLDTSGMLANTAGAEMNFCLYPNENATYSKSFKAGVCDLNGNDYVSNRNLTATIVTVSRADSKRYDANQSASNLIQEGSGDAPLKVELLKVHSTAVMPSFGSASTDDIKDCLAKKSDDEKESSVNQYTKTDCLTDKGAVFTTHVSEYKVVR